MSNKVLSVLLFALVSSLGAAPVKLDESPVADGEWGYRPESGAVTEVTPPAFSWRPQRGIVSWELECARDERFDAVEYRALGIVWNVHCPPRVLASGTWLWRYRGVDGKGIKTSWSRPRRFKIAADAAELPLPTRDELLARVPQSHPRLFVRPEDVPRLRELARGDLAGRYRDLVGKSERILKSPPPTAEPRKYPSGMRRGTPEWKELWWGNRRYTTHALGDAATLGFTWRLSGEEKYGQLARRILVDCARWDPKGATGFRYNDEAGMPYAYYFSRTYTFVNDLLSEDERQACRDVMKIRGEEMYRHLCPRHLWRPYGSHDNRSWHFLGEVGIAFLGEIEEAADWVWFAANVFSCVYPVWSDDDGGWHEGAMYWSSYIGRFTWWADVMRAALGIDAYEKPYFSKVGYYAMYLLPPGKIGGGLGDGASRRKAKDVVPLMSQLAAQARNPHWQWYVEQNGGAREEGGYIGFVRGALPRVESRPPEGLPTSRHFRGTGQVYLNTSIEDARQSVQVVFKSSQMGTWSHGNAANNSFLLWAYGERLLVRSGHYYNYGGPHHRGWVWSTRSLNNITVNGQGQLRRSASSKGEIAAFATTPAIDVVVGEAGAAYRAPDDDRKGARSLDRYTRAIVFVKPDLIIVHDRLEARQPSTFEYWLHAVNRFEVADSQHLEVRAGDVRCAVEFLEPSDLAITQTDQYDPNPWDSIKTREWHLTAKTPQKTKSIDFVTLYRPHRVGSDVPSRAELKKLDGGWVLSAVVEGGRVVALLPARADATLAADGLSSRGAIVVRLIDDDGDVVETVDLGENPEAPAGRRQPQDG